MCTVVNIYKFKNHYYIEKRVEIMVILTEKFRFIRDDVFLCPIVDTYRRKQNLKIQKINLKTGKVEFEDYIDCIHTAVIDISDKKFEDHQKRILKIRSSENFRELELTPEEKFVALKSWTAGIAEAGTNAFHIQDEIDKNLGLSYPISHFLFKFMIRADSDFMPQYLAKIDRDCMFEGTKHEASFLANIIPILNMILTNFFRFKEIKPEEKEIVKALVTRDISNKLFKKHLKFLLLRLFVEPDSIYDLEEYELDFSIELDEIRPFIGLIYDRYLSQEPTRSEPPFKIYINPEDREIVKMLAAMDVNDKLSKNNSFFLFLRILVEPNYIFKVAENAIDEIIEIILGGFYRIRTYPRPEIDEIIMILEEMDKWGYDPY